MVVYPPLLYSMHAVSHVGRFSGNLLLACMRACGREHSQAYAEVTYPCGRQNAHVGPAGVLRWAIRVFFALSVSFCSNAAVTFTNSVFFEMATHPNSFEVNWNSRWPCKELISCPCQARLGMAGEVCR